MNSIPNAHIDSTARHYGTIGACDSRRFTKKMETVRNLCDVYHWQDKLKEHNEMVKEMRTAIGKNYTGSKTLKKMLQGFLKDAKMRLHEHLSQSKKRRNSNH